MSKRKRKKTTPQKKKRLFSGMGYREVQRDNANRRGLLSKGDQALLKSQGYQNVGWDNVIALYQKLNELAMQPDATEDTLEDLFLKADRIGSKYQTSEEIAVFNQQLAAEVGAIADIVDKQFPDPETEFIDYSPKPGKAKPLVKRKHR